MYCKQFEFEEGHTLKHTAPCIQPLQRAIIDNLTLAFDSSTTGCMKTSGPTLTSPWLRARTSRSCRKIISLTQRVIRGSFTNIAPLRTSSMPMLQNYILTLVHALRYDNLYSGYIWEWRFACTIIRRLPNPHVLHPWVADWIVIMNVPHREPGECIHGQLEKV